MGRFNFARGCVALSFVFFCGAAGITITNFHYLTEGAIQFFRRHGSPEDRVTQYLIDNNIPLSNWWRAPTELLEEVRDGRPWGVWAWGMDQRFGYLGELGE